MPESHRFSPDQAPTCAGVGKALREAFNVAEKIEPAMAQLILDLPHDSRPPLARDITPGRLSRFGRMVSSSTEQAELQPRSTVGT
jgi:hypothetical protein